MLIVDRELTAEDLRLESELLVKAEVELLLDDLLIDDEEDDLRELRDDVPNVDCELEEDVLVLE